MLGTGNITPNSKFSLSKVLLVDTLGYNLLSISQLCDSGFNCLFTNEGVSVIRRSDDSVAFKGVLKGKLYLVDFSQEKAQLDTCLVAKSSLGWLWHRRLAHVGMRNLNKLLKGDHILGLKIFLLRKIVFVVHAKSETKLVFHIHQRASSPSL